MTRRVAGRIPTRSAGPVKGSNFRLRGTSQSRFYSQLRPQTNIMRSAFPTIQPVQPNLPTHLLDTSRNHQQFKIGQQTTAIVLTFSNVHILKDDFRLSWSNLHPYELLERYSVGGNVRLPREVIVHYVRPYFKANVKALATVARHDWS
jgi:hypothetical protein